MNKLIVAAVAVLVFAARGVSASSISVASPSVVTGNFDVSVRAADLFAGRDAATDVMFAFGFNVTVSSPGILSFVGATAGPLFEAASSEPGTDVFAQALGLGIDASALEPLLLATLHFFVTAPGRTDVILTSDLTSPFGGLQFFNGPFEESITGSVSLTAVSGSATAVPEPTAILLMAGGLLGIAVHMRRRKWPVSVQHPQVRHEPSTLNDR
jgi:hypothetical protein